MSEMAMTHRANKRILPLAVAFGITFLVAGTTIRAEELSVDPSIAAPPASNLRIPRPGEGFYWPPSYWVSDSNNPAPAATPAQASYEPANSLPAK